jgi:hypothetical protein
MLQQFADNYEYFSLGALPPRHYWRRQSMSAQGAGLSPAGSQFQSCRSAQIHRQFRFLQTMIHHEEKPAGP